MIVFRDADVLADRLNLEGEVWGNLPIYMTSGGFDPLHIGHARCILETTDMADADGGYVIVIVNGDGFLNRKKGGAFMPEEERAEIVAALMNLTILLVVSLYLIFEAFWRIAEPREVVGWIIIVVAGGALFIDTATAFITFKMSKTSLNMKAAFLHNLTDFLKLM